MCVSKKGKHNNLSAVILLGCFLLVFLPSTPHIVSIFFLVLGSSSS
jgi:hypothetical protein